ncbi:MAG: sensor domain-containing diguanylate cyclase [Synergistaceae bacterium]|jgi:diguanylate cyclase (GGDEF)-like protein|nr:sensor domain-containing diguanylate cyclase [Synergistaceae bacterium]
MLIPDYVSDFLLRDNELRELFENVLANLNDDATAERLDDFLGVLTVMLDEAPVGIVVISPTDKILFINRASEQLLDYDRTGNYDMTWAKMRQRKEMRAHNGRPLTEDLEPLYIALWERRRNTASVLVKSRETGAEEWISFTAFPVYGRSGLVIASVAVLQNISDFMDMQEMMHEQAIHDPLTGLSNRSVFSGNLSMAIARSKRNGTGCAVLVIDLDRFKKINDVHGYIAGDELLMRVGRRLIAEVRDTDTVSRIGEDEFAILLTDIPLPILPKIVGEISQRICSSVGVVYRIMEKEASVTASIGISLYPQDGSDDKSLIPNATEAMYQVKISGRNNFRFYHDLDKEK